jgi:hypothetical protein
VATRHTVATTRIGAYASHLRVERACIACSVREVGIGQVSSPPGWPHLAAKAADDWKTTPNHGVCSVRLLALRPRWPRCGPHYPCSSRESVRASTHEHLGACSRSLPCPTDGTPSRPFRACLRRHESPHRRTSTGWSQRCVITIPPSRTHHRVQPPPSMPRILARSITTNLRHTH